VDKCNAIINLHLATGKIGREGCGPFSITGQPNAMGVGLPAGLADMLADSDVGASKGGLFDDSRTLSALLGRPTTTLAESVKGIL